MDPRLIHRAEQAYLGALLSGQDRQGPRAAALSDGSWLPGTVTAGDFADPVHQAVFAAVTGQDGPAGWLGRLRGLLRRMFSREAREAAAYMAGLPARCPDPANLPAYAAVVAEAGAQRPGPYPNRGPGQAVPAEEQGAREDPVLASAGTWLDQQTPRRANRRARRTAQAAGQAAARPAAAPAPQPVSPAQAREAVHGAGPDVTRLARALRADALRADAQRAAGHGAPHGRESGRSPAGRQDADSGAGEADLEDRILAAMMARPGEWRDVAGWLPATVFSTPIRRDLYGLVRERLTASRPVDPLIIACDASGLPQSPSPGAYKTPDHLARFALLLGALEAASGSPRAAGRALLAEHVLVTALGPDWHADPERAWQLVSTATAASAAEPRRLPEPAAAQERGHDARSAAQRAAAARAPGQAPAPRAGASPKSAPDAAGRKAAAPAAGARQNPAAPQPSAPRPEPAPPRFRTARPAPSRPVQTQQPAPPSQRGPSQSM